MSKKSQIALFALFGIVLLIGLGFVFYLRNKTDKTETSRADNAPSYIYPIKLYIQSCLETTGKDALLHIGKQGGYYKLKKPYLNESNLSVPYYLYGYTDFSPSINSIENEISKYVDAHLLQCINNFEDFNKQGLDITYEQIHSSTKIGISSVSIDMNFPVTVIKENSVQKTEHFNSLIGKINLYEIYTTSKEITNLEYKEPNKLCLSCLYDLGKKYGLYVDVSKNPNSTLIFNIRSYNTSITGIYNFTFAVKYPDVSCKNLAGINDFAFLNQCLDSEKKRLSNKIKIRSIPDFKVKINESFFYDVNSTGKNVIFEGFTELFAIDKFSGVINFTPKNEEIGSHNIWIKAYDLAGNEDYSNFNINITK